MSILSTTPETEIATRNKINSDLRDKQAEGLTIENSNLYSSHGRAAREVRKRKDDLKIKKLECESFSDASYYDDLF